MRKPDLDPAALEALLRQVFGASVPLHWQRTPDGVSTQVYRLIRGPETFYLRVAEKAGENLETDAELHRRLGALGVHVARVVHVEPYHAMIGRSVMVTTEVAGGPVAGLRSRAVVERVIRQAGTELATLNQVPVDGFGWVRRHGACWPLRAEHPAFAAFLTSYLPARWPGPLDRLFTTPVLDAIQIMIDKEQDRPPARAFLAHGDFDVSHIFCHRDSYSGLIDFGEIRGAELTFDLGHFLLQDDSSHAPPLLPILVEGYRQVASLPPDHERAIRRSAVLLGLRQLCRWLGPVRSYGFEHPAVVQRAQRISRLVTGGCEHRGAGS